MKFDERIREATADMQAILLINSLRTCEMDTTGYQILLRAESYLVSRVAGLVGSAAELHEEMRTAFEEA